LLAILRKAKAHSVLLFIDLFLLQLGHNRSLTHSLSLIPFIAYWLVVIWPANRAAAPMCMLPSCWQAASLFTAVLTL